MQDVNVYGKTKDDEFTCCLCKKRFKGYGNNPWPLSDKEDDRCCDDCNNQVILARMIFRRNGKI